MRRALHRRRRLRMAIGLVVIGGLGVAVVVTLTTQGPSGSSPLAQPISRLRGPTPPAAAAGGAGTGLPNSGHLTVADGDVAVAVPFTSGEILIAPCDVVDILVEDSQGLVLDTIANVRVLRITGSAAGSNQVPGGTVAQQSALIVQVSRDDAPRLIAETSGATGAVRFADRGASSSGC
jgi:hypothetical protein